jgi:CHAD domain-containing protein
MVIEPDLRPDAGGGDGLQQVCADILGQAARVLQDKSLPDASVVHDFRKAMKRWRALLRLLEPFLGDAGDALQTQARDLARSLAGARDARAALDALTDLPADPSLSPRSRDAIRKRLEQIGSDAETTSIAAETRERLRTAIGFAAETARRWPTDRIDFGDIADELAKAYRRAREAVPEDWFAADAKQLHDLRKRVVIHRHQMELVVPLWPRLGKLWINEAQRLRDRLGQNQDLDVLARMAGPHQPLAPWRTRLAPLIAARQRAHRLASARLAGHLFAERPQAFRRRLIALWKRRIAAQAREMPDPVTKNSTPAST